MHVNVWVALGFPPGTPLGTDQPGGYPRALFARTEERGFILEAIWGKSVYTDV